MITFSDRRDIDIPQLVRLYQQAPWAQGRSADDTRLMLAQTDLTISAWSGAQLIGFGRVLTDYVYRASIWDVIVDKTCQHQGIGSEIVQRILGHASLARVELFWLCTRTPGFYERLGFSSKEQTGMVWSRTRQARLE